MITTFPHHHLREMLTFGIDAVCRELIVYSDARGDLPELARRGVFGGEWIHIGGGSNMLFSRDYKGSVVTTAATDVSACDFRESGDYVTVAAPAGVVTDRLVELAASRGLWGLENLSGIPGNIGGCAVQNIGAYGAELKDCVERVDWYDTHSGAFGSFRAEECGFGYRTSIFKTSGRRHIVTGVTFRLSKQPSPRLDYGNLRQAVGTADIADPMTVRRAVIAMRDSKLPDPSVVGSAGSFFKNPVMPAEVYARVVETARGMWGEDVAVPHFPLPDGTVKVPAAWFIDRCGWKGRSRGGAAVWERQPLVLVNLTGDATAADVMSLKDAIIDDVYTRFGIPLTPEVVIV